MEKRKFTRFLTQNDAYAALRGDFIKVGRIYDISLGGLAFRYVAEKIPRETIAQVEIFLVRNEYHLPDLDCTVVYDAKLSSPNASSVSSFRCGVKFRQLQEDQKDKLNFFLNNYTTGKVED